jgi:thiamine-monophosphate kinase
MKLHNLGEFGMIEKITKIIGHTSAVEGIGDDAAVLKLSWNRYLLATVDTLVQGVHFPKGKVDFRFLGQKTLAVNISDIAAMGGKPTAALISLAIPAKIEVKKVEQFYRGLEEMAKKHQIAIVGGDTVASPKAIVISLCLLGEVKKSHLLRRKGAKVGDYICVTGKFGLAAKKKYSVVPPVRLNEVELLARLGALNAMIDSSDGLAVSVRILAQASEVGAELWEKEIPREGSLEQALYGGEDYELVFTVPQSKVDKVKRQVKGITVIGKIVPQDLGIVVIDKSKLKNKEFRHF